MAEIYTSATLNSGVLWTSTAAITTRNKGSIVGISVKRIAGSAGQQWRINFWKGYTASKRVSLVTSVVVPGTPADYAWSSGIWMACASIPVAPARWDFSAGSVDPAMYSATYTSVMTQTSALKAGAGIWMTVAKLTAAGSGAVLLIRTTTKRDT